MKENAQQLKDKIKSIIENKISETTTQKVNDDGMFELSAGDKSYIFTSKFFDKVDLSNIEDFFNEAIVDISLKENNKYTFSRLDDKCVYWTDCEHRMKVIFGPIFNRVFNESFHIIKEPRERLFTVKSENYELILGTRFTIDKSLDEIENELKINYENGMYTRGEVHTLV